MNENKSCKRMKLSCMELKSECSQKLGNAFGERQWSFKCRKALGKKAANKLVKIYCPKTCETCGKS